MQPQFEPDVKQQLDWKFFIDIPEKEVELNNKIVENILLEYEAPLNKGKTNLSNPQNFNTLLDTGKTEKTYLKAFGIPLSIIAVIAMISGFVGGVSAFVMVLPFFVFAVLIINVLVGENLPHPNDIFFKNKIFLDTCSDKEIVKVMSIFSIILNSTLLDFKFEPAYKEKVLKDVYTLLTSIKESRHNAMKVRSVFHSLLKSLYVKKYNVAVCGFKDKKDAIQRLEYVGNLKSFASSWLEKTEMPSPHLLSTPAINTTDIINVFSDVPFNVLESSTKSFFEQKNALPGMKGEILSLEDILIGALAVSMILNTLKKKELVTFGEKRKKIMDYITYSSLREKDKVAEIYTSLNKRFLQEAIKISDKKEKAESLTNKDLYISQEQAQALTVSVKKDLFFKEG